MSINTVTYVRKPLYVEAIQVTSENFSELALWCQGEIVEASNEMGVPHHTRYIQVRVTNPMNPRQSQARIGDWILTSDRGYKIYTPKAFANSFNMMDEIHSVSTSARDLFQAHTPAEVNILGTTVVIPEPPVGSGPMPTQPEPTDTEVKHVPAVPPNLKEENVVYPEGYIHPEEEDDGA